MFYLSLIIVALLRTTMPIQGTSPNLQPVGTSQEDEYTAVMHVQPTILNVQPAMNGLIIQDATIKLQGN